MTREILEISKGGCWLGSREVNSTYCSSVRVHLLRANGSFNSNAHAHHPRTTRILIPQVIIAATISESRNGTAKVATRQVHKILFVSLAFVSFIHSPLLPLPDHSCNRYTDAILLPYLSNARCH